MVFDKYAQYYDLLYQDKDYEAEADYVDKIIKKYNPSAQSLLDLGCGTGKHAQLLSDKGYTVHGIDFSAQMLVEAQKKCTKNLSFSQGNVQSFNLDKKFDIITALFHVVSYQTSDRALENMFSCVCAHLNENGVFIFDCWYGPAVLTQLPEVRVKRLENDYIRVTRVAEPNLRENDNIVEVNYDVFIEDKINKHIEELKEQHAMRYLFKNEIQQLFAKHCLSYCAGFEFMTDKPLERSTWGACFVGRFERK